MSSELNLPLVTVIVPTFNLEKFILETLNSIKEQTYQNIEVLIIDDASDDSTKDVIKDSIRGDKRFQLIELKTNSGLPAVPRNVGIARAQGKYIALLDGDDLWRPEKIARQVDALETRNDIALVHSYLWWFKGKSKFLGLIYLPNPFRRRTNQITIDTRNVIQCSSVMVRTKVLRELGGFNEAQSLRAIEDYELWIRIVHMYAVAYISEIHGSYRNRSGSMSDQVKMRESLRNLETVRNTAIALESPKWYSRVMRRLLGAPAALYFHMIDAPFRRHLNRTPRMF